MTSRLCSTLALALALAGVSPGAVPAEEPCSITQITDTPEGNSFGPSLNGGSVAFVSGADHTGENPDGNFQIFLFDGTSIIQVTHADRSSDSASLDGGAMAFRSTADHTGENPPPPRRQIFLYDGSAITQITHATSGESHAPSLDGGSIAFQSDADLTGGNADGSFEIFLWDGSTITQITDATAGDSALPDLDGGAIAFHSTSDLTGENPDGSLEIFLYDGASIVQVTDATEGSSSRPSLSGGSIAFQSDADLTGENPDGSSEIFLYDGSSIVQVTDATAGDSRLPSLDAGAVAFESTADLTGDNPDGGFEVFLYDGSSIRQITGSATGESREPSLDTGSVVFRSDADLTGGNPDGNRELFLASCGVAPPLGPYLETPEIPGFRFKVRISAGGQELAGALEPECIGETLCVSGALPGRSELFARIIGPRPNGFLWVNLVRFTPSRVEVWVERTATGEINYYDLPALPREDTELTGLVDKMAFPGEGAAVGAPTAVRSRPVGAPGVVLAPLAPSRAATAPAPLPDPVTFEPEAFPGYRFTVRIFAGGEEQAARVEENCIPETVCVSGALPGRSELFLRIIGPRPNGFLWVNLVRFTTSRVEVEVEQLATGTTRSYVLEEVPRQSDELPGRVDKEAFSP